MFGLINSTVVLSGLNWTCLLASTSWSLFLKVLITGRKVKASDLLKPLFCVVSSSAVPRASDFNLASSILSRFIAFSFLFYSLLWNARILWKLLFSNSSSVFVAFLR